MKFTSALFVVATFTTAAFAAPQEQRPAESDPRGVGTPIDSCAPDREKHHGLCYTPCPSGYYGIGTVCWESCPSDSRDDGASCWFSSARIHWKKKQGRGIGKAVDHCPAGKEKHQGLCYTPCADKYKGIGPLCHYVG
ncbi:hypothetical protein BKA69DRAFT_1087164 [Paraphysoderma sedebokerense]|nr:hypothetical protein BKA69DRAFT_1087164 [Paraphysoderma sedebokerense]